MAVPVPNLLLDRAGGVRSTEKSDISSWHYAMGLSRRELAGRYIRSQRTRQHGGVSSRVVRTAVLGQLFAAVAVAVEFKTVAADHVTRPSPKSIRWTMDRTCPSQLSPRCLM